MRFRGQTYRDYDPAEKVDLAWDECEQGTYSAVESVVGLPESCFEMISDQLRAELRDMRCERDGLNTDEVSTAEAILDKYDEEAILREIVERIMNSLMYCTYSKKDHMFGLMAEWMAKEVMNG